VNRLAALRKISSLSSKRWSLPTAGLMSNFDSPWHTMHVRGLVRLAIGLERMRSGGSNRFFKAYLLIDTGSR
jgi:hypothetical protein